MARYKITKIYVVDAASRIDARDIFTAAVAHNREDAFLEFISISETDQARPNGWANTLKQQLVGSANSKR